MPSEIRDEVLLDLNSREMKMTEQELNSLALSIQDASNITACLITLSKIVNRFRDLGFSQEDISYDDRY